jgi:hypothetical protein
MSQYDPEAMGRQRTDDRPLWDILYGRFGYTALLVAHDLKLFPLLAEKSRTLAEVGEVLKIARRPAAALLTVCVSLGLVQVQAGHYSLTPLAEDYLLESSPTHVGGVLDQGRRASSAVKTKELGEVGQMPAGAFALDFERAFAGIPAQ